ncbi:MAG: hypothetical protein JXD23_14830 [Spirochaetales bacterium]|nr:hypothetical protein [Spirochaetales bacterium]
MMHGTTGKRKRRAKRAALPLYLLLASAAVCAPGDKREPAEPPPAAACLGTAVLERVDDLLAGKTFELHYLIIRGERVLSVWLVVPELDDVAAGPAFENARRLSLLTGARLGHRLVAEIPCVRILFDAFNPMIVDSRFNCWYRDIVPLANLLPDRRPADEELIRSVLARDLKYSYRRSLPPRADRIDAVSSLDEWRSLRRALRPIISPGAGRRNAAAYPMFVNDYCIVQATWPAESSADIEDEAVSGRMLAAARLMGRIGLRTGRLDMTITDRFGRLRAYGKVDGAMLGPGKALSDENIIYYRLP